MSSKRTRAATRRQQPSVDSSNVTDYLGSPGSKRQKRGENGPASSAPTVARSTRVTRSAGAVQTQGEEEPQPTGVAALRTTGQTDDEEDDEDGSVHVNFNQAILAMNKARPRERRTVNGVRIVDQQVDKAAAPNPPVTRSSQQAESKRPEKQKHRAKPVFQSDGGKEGTSSELGATIRLSQRDIRAQRRAAQQGETANTEATAARDQLPEQSQAQSVTVDAHSNSQDENAVASSDEGDDEYVARLAAEQKAFIEAPQTSENVIEVEVSIPSLGGIIKTLRHVAWTGKTWDCDSDSFSTCKTASGRVLMKHAQALNVILAHTLVAGNDSQTENACSGNNEYLRDNTEKIIRCFTSIGKIIEKICKHDLALGEGLNRHGVKARSDLLRDISARLIPMLVLVVEKACNLVTPAISGSWLRLRFNSFNLQFFLRAVRWANLLEQGLSLGLENWPIDKEFSKSDQELKADEAKLKKSKIEARLTFKQQLLALQSVAETAKEGIHFLKRQAARQRQNELVRQQLLASQQELMAARERQEAEENRRSAKRWEAVCKHTQDLNSRMDPLKAMWDRSEEVHQEYAASQAALVSSPAQTRIQASQNDPRAGPQDDLAVIDHVNDDDSSAGGQEEDSFFVDSPARNENQPGHENSQDGSVSPAHGEWDGQDWDEEEEEILSRSIYRNKYELVSMAERLHRTPYDVWRKAAWFKKLFRDNYRAKGEQIPNWWW